MGVVIAVLLVAGAIALCARWVARTGQPITRYMQHRRALRRRAEPLDEATRARINQAIQQAAADECTCRAEPGGTMLCRHNILHVRSANSPDDLDPFGEPWEPPHGA